MTNVGIRKKVMKENFDYVVKKLITYTEDIGPDICEFKIALLISAEKRSTSSRFCGLDNSGFVLAIEIHEEGYIVDTKDAIRQQFMKEYGKKDFAAITVKELCARTPVARTTFYSYYNNTDDVKCEIEDGLISGLLTVAETISAGNYPDMDMENFMDETESYIKEHWTYMYAFLVRQPNLRFIRKWKDAIKHNFRRRYPNKRHAKNFDAISEIMASSVISAYTYWMEHPDTCSIAEVKPLIEKLLESLVSFL